MAAQQDNVNQFLEAVNATPELWQAMDPRAVALRIRDERHCLVTRILLDDRSREEIPQLMNLPVRGPWIERLREPASVPLLIFDDWTRDRITILQAKHFQEVFDDRICQTSTMNATPSGPEPGP